jgi:polysaccharide export outer membrane protein
MFRTNPDYTFSDFKPSEKEYKLQPFDKLDVKVFSNDGYKLADVISNSATQNQPVTYLVEFDGQVKLPSLGRITLSGMTIREAETLLEKKFSELYVDPFVLITVTNKRVVVFNSGSTAGKVIPLDNENYTLIEALAQAGGINDFGQTHRIKLVRGDLNNPQIFLFNIRDIDDMKEANFVLQANDIIYVEARTKYASKLLSELSPYISLMTSGLFIYGLFIR